MRVRVRGRPPVLELQLVETLHIRNGQLVLEHDSEEFDQLEPASPSWVDAHLLCE